MVILLIFTAAVVFPLTVSLPVAKDELLKHHFLSDAQLDTLKESIKHISHAAQQNFFGKKVFLDEPGKEPHSFKNVPEYSDYSQFLFEGDIVLSPVQADSILTKVLADQTRKSKRASMLAQFGSDGHNYRWTFPIPYSYHYSLNADDIKDIEKALDFWQKHTCVVYKRETKPTGDAIEFFKGSGCYSLIGKFGGSQSISIGEGCTSLGTVAHEIGHSLGLWHEQSRPDSLQYVRILAENIVGPFISNFLRRDPSEVSYFGVPYDLGSVMHYGPQAFVNDWSKNSLETINPGYQRTIGQRARPAFYDVKILNKAYCSDVCPPLFCYYNGYPNVKNCSECTCPEGLSGTQCDKIAPSVVSQCGGILDANSSWNEISSPGYPDLRYLAGTQCSWLLRAPTGGKVVLEFLDRLQFFCTEICLDYVEVKNGSDFGQTGMRFCCNNLPEGQFISETNEMLVLLRTPISMDVGFKARFKQNIVGLSADSETHSASKSGQSATGSAAESASSKGKINVKWEKLRRQKRRN